MLRSSPKYDILESWTTKWNVLGIVAFTNTKGASFYVSWGIVEEAQTVDGKKTGQRLLPTWAQQQISPICRIVGSTSSPGPNDVHLPGNWRHDLPYRRIAKHAYDAAIKEAWAMCKPDSWDPFSRHSADVFTADGNYRVSAELKRVRFLGDVSLTLDVGITLIDRSNNVSQ